jgi:cell division protein FtsZ
VIYLIGVGDGGCAALNHIADQNLGGIKLIAVNTSSANLPYCHVDERVVIGSGLGAGGNPEHGKAAADEDREKIKATVQPARRVVIVAGMGGGTGSGAGPKVAEVARSLGKPVSAVVSVPFIFEGTARDEIARDAIQELKSHVAALVIVDYTALLKLIGSPQQVNLQRAYATGAKMLAWKTLSHLI